MIEIITVAEHMSNNEKRNDAGDLMLGKKGEIQYTGKGFYYAKVSVGHIRISGEMRVIVYGDDNGQFDGNDCVAIHKTMLAKEKAGHGRYVQSPVNPDFRGDTPVLMNGYGAKPYVSMQRGTSRAHVNNKIIKLA